jgi:hypothetical protein
MLPRLARRTVWLVSAVVGMTVPFGVQLRHAFETTSPVLMT